MWPPLLFRSLLLLLLPCAIMKRQWWEVVAAEEPYQYLCRQRCSPLQALPQAAQCEGLQKISPRQDAGGPEATTRGDCLRPEPSDPTSPRTNPCTPTDSENLDLDEHSTQILARALKVEPKHVPVEALAYSVLCKRQRGQHIMKSDLVDLWEAMPTYLKNHDPKGGPGRYVVFGANPRKHDQVTNPTSLLPHAAELCIRFIQQTHPMLEFSTIALRMNMQTTPHRDTRNGSDESYIQCLTSVTGGGLWVADPAGSTEVQHLGQDLKGTVYDVQEYPLVFPARSKLHATMPWTGAERLVLVAFTTLNSLSSAPIRDWLHKLGVPVPQRTASLLQPTLQQAFAKTAEPATHPVADPPVVIQDDSL